MGLTLALAASASNIRPPLNEWADCVQYRATVLAVTSKEAADVVATAAMGLCTREQIATHEAAMDALRGGDNTNELAQGIIDVQYRRIYQSAVGTIVVLRAGGSTAQSGQKAQPSTSPP